MFKKLNRVCWKGKSLISPEGAGGISSHALSSLSRSPHSFHPSPYEHKIQQNTTHMTHTCTYTPYMFNERWKEERSKQGQTNNKAKQHSTPKAVTFPKQLVRRGSYM